MRTTLAPVAQPIPSSEDQPDVLRGRDILCFSHDWTGDPLSKTHLMRLLARDNRILWVNSIGYRAPKASRADLSRAFRKLSAAASPIQEPEPNIFVLNPLAIPAYGQPAIRALNRQLLKFQVRRAMAKLGFRRAINWIFNPAAGLIAGELGEDALIYHCVDEYTAFSGVCSRSLAEIEDDLLKKADAVFVSSDRLLQSKGAVSPRAHLVRHGVDHDHFRRSLERDTVVPAEVARLPRPILGYFGLIADDWVDVALLEHVARSFPAASMVLIGKVTMDVSRLEALPNVHLLSRKPYESLPSYSKGFDVALIPFPISEVTLNANPLKAREYLASGLPVVSTAIPEVEVLSLCRIGRNHQHFVEEVAEALAEPGPNASRSQAVIGESWAGRLEEIRQHLSAQEMFGQRAKP